MTDLVTIVTPIYNSSQFLGKTIQSVLSQTYENWEMIIVDDCSQDNSLAIAENYAAVDQRIRAFKLPKNSGAAAARNAAIKVARGRFVAFLDSDDLWVPKKLEKQINFMLNHGVALSFSSYYKINEHGDIFELMGVPEKVSYNELLKTCVIGCLTAVYDTNALGKIYMPTNTKREDFATWLGILKKVDFAFSLAEPLAQYRVYYNQSSGKKVSMAKENWRLYREQEKLDLFQASYYFSHYAVRGVLRTTFPRFARALGILR